MNTPVLTRAVQALSGLFAPPPAAPVRVRVRAPQGRPTPALSDPGRSITFRFGLTGRRWGAAGPAVLMVHGKGALPESLRALVAPLLRTGRQVIALDAPGGSGALDALSHQVELAMAIGEAAVEIRELEAVVGHGPGAAATAIAVAQGVPAQRVVLVKPPASADGALRIPALVVRGAEPREALERLVTDFLSGPPPERRGAVN